MSAEDTSLEKKAISESPDSKESSGSPQSIIVSADHHTAAQPVQMLPLYFWLIIFNPIQSMEEEGSVSEDMSKKDDPPSSVDIAPPVGILSDYPYCVTPQQMVRRPKFSLRFDSELTSEVCNVCYQPQR